METVFLIVVCCSRSVWGSGSIRGWPSGTGFALCEARMYLYRGPGMPDVERKEQGCSSEPRGYWGFGDGGESPA